MISRSAADAADDDLNADQMRAYSSVRKRTGQKRLPYKPRPYNPNRLARGIKNDKWHSQTLKRSYIAFDPETFDQIRQYAIRNETSFTGAVRDLVEFGLEDMRDD